ncbi:MAG: hypothetical protein FWH48_00190 [Oscillospiraceae bacterium]|nr:hypothetical protein [Oscillospiraceae bacterium]
MADFSSNQYRPLKITHGGGYDQSEPDYGVKCAQIERHIDSLQKKGYGGIVTNVPFSGDYMQNETAKKLLKHEVAYCKKNNMRIWLYDEKGYPSGTAGGLTLKKNPDFEARGIVALFSPAAPGESVRFEFLHGHEAPVCAFAYSGSCFDDADESSAEDLIGCLDLENNLVYKNNTDKPKFVIYVMSKRLYEGTHACHNVCEARRYIDLMNPAAVAEFIDNTYREYGRFLGEYFSNGIEAMFTDEPSLMGFYLNHGLTPPSILDETDETIELLPVLNWTPDFAGRFFDLCGYELLPRLLYVFGGNSARAADIREDYHNAASKFYEEAFFAQIQKFCQEVKLPFSGHALMEEAIALHPPFEGNFFELLKHMEYPGIDMLTTIPEKIMHQAQTPRLVDSIAAINGRAHVMSEVSSHVEGGKQTYEQMMGSCVLQYALGVDTFTSYYGENALEEGDYFKWNDTLGKIAALANGGRRNSNILLYYPIESINRNYVPQHTEQSKKLYDFSFAEKNSATNDFWASLSRSLLLNQLDYYMADYASISASPIEDGAIKLSGNEFRYLVLPPCDINEKLLDLISRLEKENIAVFALSDPRFADETKKLQGRKNVTICETEKELIEALIKTEAADVCIDSFGNRPEVVCMKKTNHNGEIYLFVNTKNEKVKARLELKTDKKAFGLYDPESGETAPLEAAAKDGKVSFNCEFEPYGFCILC